MAAVWLALATATTDAKPMSFATRVAELLGLRSTSSTSPTATPSPDSRVLYVSPSEANRIGTVFTCVTIIATAIEQLSLDIERDGMPLPPTPYSNKPDPDVERSTWLQQLTADLALHGNAYLRIFRHSDGSVAVARRLDPLTVWPYRQPDGTLRYSLAAGDLDAYHVRHLRYMPPVTPGQLLGLGPIQAAQTELTGHRDVTSAGARYFRDSGHPSGILHTEQQLTANDRASLLEDWNSAPAGRTRLLTHGLTYDGLVLSARDAQWLEARRYSKTEIVDLFGVPAALVLGVETGSSRTYANVAQDWMGFIRFRLMRYVREIEAAVSATLPRGQQARLNLDALLRPDTASRMDIHAAAISAGIYSAAWARDIERIPHTAAPSKALP